MLFVIYAAMATAAGDLPSCKPTNNCGDCAKADNSNVFCENGIIDPEDFTNRFGKLSVKNASNTDGCFTKETSGFKAVGLCVLGGNGFKSVSSDLICKGECLLALV